MTIKHHRRSTCSQIPDPADRVPATIISGQSLSSDSYVSQSNIRLTLMPPMLHRPEMPVRRPLESDLPGLVIPSSSPHPINARCHRMTPIPRNFLMDGTLPARLWPHDRITLPMIFHCSRSGFSLSVATPGLGSELTFLETTISPNRPQHLLQSLRHLRFGSESLEGAMLHLQRGHRDLYKSF